MSEEIKSSPKKGKDNEGDGSKCLSYYLPDNK